VSNFIRVLGEKIVSFPIIRPARYHEAEIQKLVLDYLGIDDLGKLRDRFEGESFYKNSLSKILGLFSVNTFLEKAPFAISDIDLKTFIPYVEHNGMKFKVVVFDFGEFPIIQKNEDLPIIFVIKKTHLEFLIAGYATLDQISNPENCEDTGTNRRVYKSLKTLNTLKK
jgi:hypothetical protein